MANEEYGVMTDSDLAVGFVLPAEIKSFEYKKNSHFIKFGHWDGSELKIVANEMVRYACNGCKFEMLTDHNHGELKCPLCGLRNMEPQWMKKQTCFIPEKESEFEWPEKK